MSRNVYSLVERRRYAHGAEEMQLNVPHLWAVGEGVADALRQALPDVDDVTIGRALIALAEYVNVAVRARVEIPTVNMVAGLLAGGLQMTRPEWEEAPGDEH